MRRAGQTTKQQSIVFLDIDKASEWCDSFVLVQKANRKVSLCLYVAYLNKVLIMQIHKGLTLTNILPRLAGDQYLMFINATLGYYNFRLDEQLSCLIPVFCHFGKYRYRQLPFNVVPTGVMFQRKIHQLFQGLLNVFGITDDILIVGFNEKGRDHNATLTRSSGSAGKPTLSSTDKCLKF